jgi:hypothetical protein
MEKGVETFRDGPSWRMQVNGGRLLRDISYPQLLPLSPCASQQPWGEQPPLSHALVTMMLCYQQWGQPTMD